MALANALASNFCVFEYPNFSIRKPPFAENYITTTNLTEWLRSGLMFPHTLKQKHKLNAPGVDGGMPTTQEEASKNNGGGKGTKAGSLDSGSPVQSLSNCGFVHPLLGFKGPVHNIHVTMKDVTESGGNAFRAVLWDAFYDRSVRVGTNIRGHESVYVDALPPTQPELSKTVCAHFPVIDDEKKYTLEVHVTAQGDWEQYTASGLGFGKRVADDVEETMWVDVVRSPVARCPSQVAHPLGEGRTARAERVGLMML